MNYWFPWRATAAKAGDRSSAWTKPYKAHFSVLSQSCLGHLVDKRQWKCFVCQFEGGEEFSIISQLSMCWWVRVQHRPKGSGWMRKPAAVEEQQWSGQKVCSADQGRGVESGQWWRRLWAPPLRLQLNCFNNRRSQELHNSFAQNLTPVERNVWRQRCLDHNTHNPSILTYRKCQICSSLLWSTKAWNQFMI